MPNVELESVIAPPRTENATASVPRQPAVRPVVRGRHQNLILILLGACFLLPVLFVWVIAPYDPNAIALLARLRPPLAFGGTIAHPFGTDELGRDLLSRLMYGMQVSIVVATLATIIGAIVGTSLGLVAAASRGLVDNAVSILIDSQAAIPHMIIGLLLIAVFGNSMPVLVVILGTYGWERYARLARGNALSLLKRGFVIAARTYGIGRVRLFIRHLLPNMVGPLIVTASITFPEAMLLESTLSFFGLGLQPPTASLGSMLGLGREQIFLAWWAAVLPGMALVALSLFAAFAGDRLRDILDPTNDK